jgi:hypothetical protein
LTHTKKQKEKKVFLRADFRDISATPLDTPGKHSGERSGWREGETEEG